MFIARDDSKLKYKSVQEFRETLQSIVMDKPHCINSFIPSYVDFACDIWDRLHKSHLVGGNVLYSYCARSVHDSHEGGLLEHTVKVFSMLISMLCEGDTCVDTYYTNIFSNVDMPALIIGAIIHDIGKVFEYENSNNSPIHYVSHPMLGIEYIVSNHQENIIEEYGTETYWRIISILGQHHGEFGEKPQTLEAYLVHLADYQETKLQILEESLGIDIKDRQSADTMSNNWLVKSKYIPFRLNVKE